MSGGPGGSLHDRFLSSLGQHGDRVALRIGDRSWTYLEVHDLAGRWAAALADAVGGRPRAVGVFSGADVDTYAGLLAALYLGSPAVPLNPAFPDRRTRWMVEAAGVDVVVGSRPARNGKWVPEPGPPVVWPDAVASRTPIVPAPVDPSEVAYVLFTSGSTGRPKGVPVRHGNADHYFRHVRHRYGFTCDDVFSQTFDLTFDLAMFDLFAAWEAGGAVVPVPVTAYRDLGAFVRGRGITAWFSTPSTIGLAARLGGLRPASMPSLRWSLFCGEPLVVDDVARWLRAAPGSVVENLYGPTEATISCAVHRWSSRSAREAVNGVVPIGRLHRGLDHLVVDAHGDPAETGELCLAGPQVFDGYLDPADDEGRFLHRGSRRWYRTGDRVGRTARGELAFLGRVDDQVQVRGWRVEPGEIEHRLRDRPEVDSAVVVAPHVDGGRTLVAFYTGVPCADAVLAGHLARDLPRTLMPDRYVHVEDLPRNANDKVDRRALEARASALLADRADDHRHHPPEEDS